MPRVFLGLTALLLTVLLWPIFGAPYLPPPPAQPLPFDDLADRYRDYSYYQAAVYRNTDPGRPMVALTFDDGPDPNYTGPILAVLRHYHVPATFFVVGENASRYPWLVQEEAKVGEIGSHTYSHPNLLTLSPAEVRWQMSHNALLLRLITGEWPRFFRAPYGLFSDGAYKEAEHLGERVTMWTVCLEHHGINSPQAMADRVVDNAQPGYIILMHDARLNRDDTVKALPLVITGLENRGYRLVTLSELLNQRPIPLDRLLAREHPAAI